MMRAVIQRVQTASVQVDNSLIASVRKGLLILLGIEANDGIEEAEFMASKITRLRLFDDFKSEKHLDCLNAGGSVLCVSQFTLFGDVRRGNRPSFTQAAPSDAAFPIWKHFCKAVRSNGVRCAEGIFGASMSVHSVNSGPVTLMIDSNELKLPRRN